MFAKKKFFTSDQEKEIVSAIVEAEKNTSGEIRVHIEKKINTDPVQRAQQVFHHLKMSETAQRNGILFYLATDSRQFALIGDQGIHEKVGQEFWEKVTSHVITSFKEGNFSKGLANGIKECGEQLKQYFPYKSDDKNELSNEISY